VQTRPASVSRATPVRPEALPRAVSSFGAAELDGWTYVIGGHGGRTHHYGAEHQWDGFARLRTDDPSQREALPPPDERDERDARVQGTALVAARGRLVRIGGLHAEGSEGSATLASRASVRAYDPRARCWSALPDLPAPRSSHDAAALGDSIYVFGGWNLRGDTGEAEWAAQGLVLDLAAPTPAWRPIAQPRAERGVAVAAGTRELFVFGGMDADGELSSAVDAYDPELGTWRALPDFPEPGFGLAAVAAGDTLYASGRSGGVWRLAPNAQQWQRCGELFVPRLFHRMVASGGALLVLGGSSAGRPVAWIEVIEPGAPRATATFALPFAGAARQRQGTFLDGSSLFLFGGNRALAQHAFEPADFVAEAWRLDLGARGAQALPALPVARQSLVCVAAPDEESVYALGGLGHDGERERSCDEIWRCELETGAWTVLEARLPRRMTQFRALVHGAELLLVGGMDFDPRRAESMELCDAIHAAELAHLERGFHDTGVRLPAPRRAFGAALVGEKLYLAGGIDAGFAPVTAFEAYDFETRSWTTLPSPTTARISPELVALAGKLYLCAGLAFDSERHARPVELVEEFDPERGRWRTLATPLSIDAHEVQAFVWNERLAFASTWNERGVLELALVDPRADSATF